MHHVQEEARKNAQPAAPTREERVSSAMVVSVVEACTTLVTLRYVVRREREPWIGASPFALDAHGDRSQV